MSTFIPGTELHQTTDRKAPCKIHCTAAQLTPPVGLPGEHKMISLVPRAVPRQLVGALFDLARCSTRGCEPAKLLLVDAKLRVWGILTLTSLGSPHDRNGNPRLPQAEGAQASLRSTRWWFHRREIQDLDKSPSVRLRLDRIALTSLQMCSDTANRPHLVAFLCTADAVTKSVSEEASAALSSHTAAIVWKITGFPPGIQSTC